MNLKFWKKETKEPEKVLHSVIEIYFKGGRSIVFSKTTNKKKVSYLGLIFGSGIL